MRTYDIVLTGKTLPVANVFGAILMVGSSVQIFLLANEFRKYGWMGEDAPVYEAAQSAIRRSLVLRDCDKQ